MQDKNRDITSLLKHIADLMGQIKLLKAENEGLGRKNEQLLEEIARYKHILSQQHFQDKDVRTDKKKASPIRYKTATALYVDIQGDRSLSASPDSRALVDSLDEILIRLEEINTKYNIKNIRAVGDSFIGVGGIPEKNLANPIHVLLAAIEMQYVAENLQAAGKEDNSWNLRIGVHTGTVTAAVRGKKGQQYDVKGSTVEVAMRIRHVCRDGEILISGDTYEFIKEYFNCEYRGQIPVKYQGDIRLYMVKGLKSEFSLRGRGIIPNKNLSIRMGLIQFTDLQEMVLDKMEKELPQHLYYHNIKHTVDVVTQAELIGLGENVTDEELLLLKTAALFHDTGHMRSYERHEYFSTLIAREILSEFNYTQNQVETICELIMTTKLPPNPSNRLEEIMCDADLDYLGRSDMIPVSNTLFDEMKERKMVNSLNDWNHMQLKFISGHQYFTRTARNLREVNKQMQIERIRNLMEATVM